MDARVTVITMFFRLQGPSRQICNSEKDETRQKRELKPD
jgi:hypothetical protein